MVKHFSLERWCKIRVNGLESEGFSPLLKYSRRRIQPPALAGSGNPGSPRVYLHLSPTVLIKMGEGKFGQ